MKAARIYLSVLCLTLGFLFGFSPAEKKSKATWIWQSETIGRDKQQILSFCEQNEITLIYLRIDMNKTYDYYRSFIRDANARGIEVHAVAGHPAWALASNQKRMLKIVNWVKQYNESVTRAEQVRGIQLDIEPYLLPQWETEQERVIREWQSNIDVFTAEVKKDSDLEASAAIPFWMDDIPTPSNRDLSLSTWLISRFDTVCIMAYRDELDGPNGLLSLVDEEMNQADKLERRVLIAVNMKEIEDDHASFAEEGAEEMNQLLEKLPAKMADHPSYSGNAIHDYRYWKEAAGVTPPVIEQPKGYRGTYIWRAETLKSERDEILDFAKENDVNLLYVRIDLQQSLAMYRDFVGKANAAGIEVHAMGGHPIWALEENRSKILKLVKWVKAYNQEASADEQFRGVHLDIEPYVMPRWRDDKEAVLRQWMGNIEAFVAEAKEGDLETSVDLAAWLDNTPTPGRPDTPFSHWMMDQLDHTTLMAFRDRAESIVRMVENQMKYASDSGKKLVVAVETKESHEGNFVSFYEEGVGEMNRQLERVAQLLGGYSSYMGQAIHAYEYWKNGKD
ncbi:hypothetical protein P9578_18745 [Brevibacillus choshinensis]|uniref:hypothetical protein n=1 Tax=Brevibacillus choshinensis TaxID=54911 RepID=UPI002E1DA7B4|nr:hypothetical protein [Brevibacillus choshinensis]MED4782100.1 hypothetical protein [Brevibacillus choshinensis]